MIDIKFLRENPDIVKQNIKNKFQDEKLPLVDEVIELDEKSRSVKCKGDELRAQRNSLSDQIGNLMRNGQKEEAEKRRAEMIEKQRLEAEQKTRERQERENAFKDAFANNFENQETQIRDADGNRWIKCEFCGKVAKTEEFGSYGGPGRINLGTCKDCSNEASSRYERLYHSREQKKRLYDPRICPECGGHLQEKNGKYGLFLGCSNYPRCRYTRNQREKKY